MEQRIIYYMKEEENLRLKNKLPIEIIMLVSI